MFRIDSRSGLWPAAELAQHKTLQSRFAAPARVTVWRLKFQVRLNQWVLNLMGVGGMKRKIDCSL